jgi:endoglucanase
MIKKILSAMAIGCAFWACDSGSATVPTAPTTSTVVPVDYTLGRTMNAVLGRGINLGNSWDSDGSDDSGWGNPIRDTDFAVIKAAGFNSVRIPVRWQNGSDYTNHTVNPDRLAGVIMWNSTAPVAVATVAHTTLPNMKPKRRTSLLFGHR